MNIYKVWVRAWVSEYSFAEKEYHVVAANVCLASDKAEVQRGKDVAEDSPGKVVKVETTHVRLFAEEVVT